MIKFIYGAYGCGKTTSIMNMIAEDTKRGIHTFLIIPDQEALQTERLSLSALPPAAQLNLEVLSFSRLYNRVCREYGGLSYSYMTKPMRSLIMWKTLHELAPLLEDYGEQATRDMSLCDKLLNALNEFKANGINAASLEIASKKIQSDSPLHRRLRDIALIYSCFDNFVSEKYTDSADDLSKLYDILKEHSFFSGCNVYFDSFYSYTEVQHKIIEEIFKNADNVTLTIPLSDPESDDISTVGIKYSQQKLLRSAELCGSYSNTVLYENMRMTSPALSYLSKNLWRLGSNDSQAPSPDGSIISEICDNPYTEAEAVSAHILELMRGGARARDMVIIARDPEQYRGIIDTALKKSNIPYYLAFKSDLCSMPPIKLLLCALKIKKYNWRKEDVIFYIKTGLCGVDIKDANLFEEYVNTWNIHGSGFMCECWTMNPDGLVTSVSARGQEILSAANRVREAVVTPLLKFFILLDAAENTAQMCRAVYTFMLDIGLEESIARLACAVAQRNDLKQARELSAIYEIILKTLADVAELIGEDTCDTDEFIQILRHVFDRTEIGSIPTSIDEVTIGGADMLRASNPKYAFIIGMCEGEFPAIVSDVGIFSSGERETLTELGIELSGNSDTRSSDELMYIQRAFATPCEKLFVFTHKAQINGSVCFPSLAFNRIEKLFPALKPHVYKADDFDYLVPAVKNAASLFRSIENGAKKNSLQAAVAEHIPEFFEHCRLQSQTSECRISQENNNIGYENHLRLSATSFEKYVKCPFNYYCSNVLHLRQKPVSRFKANDVGVLVHYMLEVLIKNIFPDGNETPMDDETIIALADNAISEYLQKICPDEILLSKQTRHLYTRMKNLVLLLVRNTVKEFSKSEFRPAFFELSANGKESNPSPLVFKLDNGNDVSFSGYIDRVDIYKKDGDVYIRVIDYKTGTKLFSLDDIDYGINLQMLLYLFTLCKNNSERFRRALGLEQGKNALPAGVIYLSTAVPVIEAEDYCSSQKILSSVEDKLPRTGLLLDDEEILLAMNSDLDERFLAGIKRKKDNSLSGKALTSAEQFAEIYEQLQDTVVKFASALQGGNADATPLDYGPNSPCKYCASKPICKKIQK